MPKADIGAALAVPGWHDKPPVPGLYAGIDLTGEIPPVAIHFTRECLDAGRPKRPNMRWYGPIPPDPKQ